MHSFISDDRTKPPPCALPCVLHRRRRTAEKSTTGPLTSSTLALFFADPIAFLETKPVFVSREGEFHAVGDGAGVHRQEPGEDARGYQGAAQGEPDDVASGVFPQEGVGRPRCAGDDRGEDAQPHGDNRCPVEILHSHTIATSVPADSFMATDLSA